MSVVVNTWQKVSGQRTSVPMYETIHNTTEEIIIFEHNTLHNVIEMNT